MNYPNLKLELLSVDTNGDDIKTTIGYCNPNASDELLKEFGQKLNAFTTNTFKGIRKVETDDITDATAPKPIPEFTVEGNWFDSIDEITQQVNLSNSVYYMVNTNQSGGTVTVKQYSGFDGIVSINVASNSEITINKLIAGYGAILELSVAETSTYQGIKKYMLCVTE